MGTVSASNGLVFISTCLYSSKNKGKKNPGCVVFIEGYADGNAAEIDLKCRTGSKTTFSLEKTITNITHSASIPDVSAQGFKIFEEVEGHRYAIYVMPGTNLVIDEVRISGLKHLGAVFLVRGLSLDLSKLLL